RRHVQQITRRSYCRHRTSLPQQSRAARSWPWRVSHSGRPRGHATIVSRSAPVVSNHLPDKPCRARTRIVDQPVLTPLLAWVSLKLSGPSLPGLRVWPALAAWATVVIAGLTAREFGGGRRAQLLAAVATATMPSCWPASVA